MAADRAGHLDNGVDVYPTKRTEQVTHVTHVTQISRAAALTRVHSRGDQALLARVLRFSSRKATACEVGGTTPFTAPTLVGVNRPADRPARKPLDKESQK